MGNTLPYWRLSGLYLWYFAALGAFLPYWPLYLQGAGYDARQIGVLMALLAGTRIVAPNCWGWLADHTGRDLSLIRLACFFTLIGFAPVLFVADFRSLAVVTAVFGFFWNAFLPTLEALNLTWLEGDSERYSRIRLWGSVGFIGTVVVVGELLDRHLKISQLPWIMALLFGLMWLTSLIVPKGAKPAHDTRHAPLRAIVRRPEVLGLLAVGLLMQMAHGPYYTFYSVHLANHGFDRSQIGELWALGVLAEILLFLLLPATRSGLFLRTLLLGSIALSALRWLLIAWGARWVWVLVSAQLLHAASFGAFHVASIALVHRYFWGRTQHRGQALYSSLSYGAGGALGSLVSGFAWGDFGAGWVYSGAAAVALAAWLVAWIWIDRHDAPQRRSIMR